MTDFAPLLRVALDLTSSLMAEDRYSRLIEAVALVTPSDAICLLRADGEALVPLAARGLVPEVVGRRFITAEHPRLEVIASSNEPVRFPEDSRLPDPFDGLVEGDPHALDQIHACVGCPLHVDGQLVGALTLDSLNPKAFDELAPELLAMLAALAGAALHTSSLIEALERGAAHQGMLARELLRETNSSHRPSALIGASRPMRDLRDEIKLVARTDYPVLVLGESGTGKELVARAVHSASARSDAAFIQVNCAALPEAMAESELFGHVRGAFTGAERDRAGKLSIADGGTLVLDEIGELPLALQPKLLRTLQQGEIQRVGEDKALTVDVRIIASTNRDLEREVRAGRFRADLFHRLNVYPLRVPALRERRDDIAQLAGHFSELAARRVGTGAVRFTEDVRQALHGASWPGNVRELKNAVSRMVLRASAEYEPGGAVVVDSSHLMEHSWVNEAQPPAQASAAGERTAPAASHDMRSAVEGFQRNLIERTVCEEGQNWAAAARKLGLHRSNLHHLAKRLGLR
jgi:anaerobic nitric oxide reductase transcription regulator